MRPTSPGEHSALFSDDGSDNSWREGLRDQIRNVTRRLEYEDITNAQSSPQPDYNAVVETTINIIAEQQRQQLQQQQHKCRANQPTKDVRRCLFASPCNTTPVYIRSRPYAPSNLQLSPSIYLHRSWEPLSTSVQIVQCKNGLTTDCSLLDEKYLSGTVSPIPPPKAFSDTCTCSALEQVLKTSDCRGSNDCEPHDLSVKEKEGNETANTERDSAPKVADVCTFRREYFYNLDSSLTECTEMKSMQVAGETPKLSDQQVNRTTGSSPREKVMDLCDSEFEQADPNISSLPTEDGINKFQPTDMTCEQNFNKTYLIHPAENDIQSSEVCNRTSPMVSQSLSSISSSYSLVIDLSKSQSVSHDPATPVNLGRSDQDSQTPVREETHSRTAPSSSVKTTNVSEPISASKLEHVTNEKLTCATDNTIPEPTPAVVMNSKSLATSNDDSAPNTTSLEIFSVAKDTIECIDHADLSYSADISRNEMTREESVTVSPSGKSRTSSGSVSTQLRPELRETWSVLSAVESSLKLKFCKSTTSTSLASDQPTDEINTAFIISASSESADSDYLDKEHEHAIEVVGFSSCKKVIGCPGFLSTADDFVSTLSDPTTPELSCEIPDSPSHRLPKVIIKRKTDCFATVKSSTPQPSKSDKPDGPRAKAKPNVSLRRQLMKKKLSDLSETLGADSVLNLGFSINQEEDTDCDLPQDNTTSSQNIVPQEDQIKAKAAANILSNQASYNKAKSTKDILRSLKRKLMCGNSNVSMMPAPQNNSNDTTKTARYGGHLFRRSSKPRESSSKCHIQKSAPCITKRAYVKLKPLPVPASPQSTSRMTFRIADPQKERCLQEYIQSPLNLSNLPDTGNDKPSFSKGTLVCESQIALTSPEVGGQLFANVSEDTNKPTENAKFFSLDVCGQTVQFNKISMLSKNVNQEKKDVKPLTEKKSKSEIMSRQGMVKTSCSVSGKSISDCGKQSYSYCGSLDLKSQTSSKGGNGEEACESPFKLPVDPQSFLAQRKGKQAIYDSPKNSGQDRIDPEGAGVDILKVRRKSKALAEILAAFMLDPQVKKFQIRVHTDLTQMLKYLCERCKIEMEQSDSEPQRVILIKTKSSRTPMEQDVCQLIRRMRHAPWS